MGRIRKESRKETSQASHIKIRTILASHCRRDILLLYIGYECQCMSFSLLSHSYTVYWGEWEKVLSTCNLEADRALSPSLLKLLLLTKFHLGIYTGITLFICLSEPAFGTCGLLFCMSTVALLILGVIVVFRKLMA